MLHEIFDGMPIRRHVKIDGDVNVDRPNSRITGMMKPECIIPWMRAGSYPFSL